MTDEAGETLPHPSKWRAECPHRASPTLAQYLAMEAKDGNAFWYLESGDHQNLLEEAIGILAELEQPRVQHVVGHKVFSWQRLDAVAMECVSDDRPLVRMLFSLSPAEAREIANDLQEMAAVVEAGLAGITTGGTK